MSNFPVSLEVGGGSDDKKFDMMIRNSEGGRGEGGRGCEDTWVKVSTFSYLTHKINFPVRLTPRIWRCFL